ncbi:MAG: amino acid adenylation domain-containing protein [Candidatus Binatia bacterium]
MTLARTVTDSVSSEFEERPDLAGAERADGLNPYGKSNLTANQLQVWLAQNLLPESPVFNLAVALHLQGRLDAGRFQDAFSVLVACSDALRTTIEQIDGTPMQRVLPRVSSRLDAVDCSQDPDAQTAAKAWMADRCRTPLNWRGRLFDSALIRLAEDHFIWYLNAHHLICDGWSFELIYHKMADLYRCAREGQLPQKIDLPPFADYLAYERANRRSARYRKTEAYWSEFLAEAGETVGFYGKMPSTKNTRVHRIAHDLGAERTKQLKAAARALAGETGPAAVFDVFAAVLIGYLGCLNGHDTYTIGVPFHNRRSKSSFRETIGFFSEVLPVRVTIAEDETFASLAKKFNREIRRTLRYGQCSVTNPLFKRVYEVALNYHTRSFSDFAGIPARPEWIHNGQGDESLVMQVHDFDSADKLAVDFDLHEAVFEESDGQRVVAHFMRVLDAFLRDPQKPLRRLSLASEQEAHRMLAQGSQSPAQVPQWSPVYEAFERRAKEQPDHPAVLSEHGNLTYGELNRRATRISRLLEARGVRPRARVVIYLTRSPDTLAAILGVLKAGAAYVPVDPRYSTEWLQFILEDTGAPVVLTERKLIDSPHESSAEVIYLDELAREDDLVDHPSASVSADDIAYVIYTSGSTGTPKGVEITHRALANFVGEAARVFDLEPSDRVLQFASISFDTSVEEIFPCLVRGASLVLCPGPEFVPDAAFLEQCRAWQITVLDLPTAYWHELTARLCTERQVIPDPIRLVVIGGERAIPERVALWQAFVTGNARLLNTYGPTEATVAATVADLTHTPVQCGVAAEVAIGRPIANVQAFVLDRNLNLVPEGVPGELYIGGIGLARGYLGRPELTAEKFIPNPFDGGSGSRLYRTGDIARYREDGNLEFLRRRDDQVKIRGFRVELDGIAAVLRQHPLVREAAVLQEGASNSGRLVAYVVPEGAAVLHLKDIQNFVGSRLPEYMVPAALVPLESMPLTPRGKLGRRALHLTQSRQPENPETLTPPQTPVEEKIAQQWRELLSLDAVGRDQHFFELGGHSLLAAQAIARIRREFGVEIPLRVIFEAPTIALLAGRVEQALRPGHAPEEAAPVLRGAYNGRAPASDSQVRIWYMDQMALESSAYNVTAAIRFTGTLDRAVLRQSVDKLVERHESLRTTVENDAGQPVQVIAPALRLELPEIDLSATPEEQRIDLARQILREEGRRPFDLSRGPLLRLFLLRLGEHDYVLLLSMHHLISDQWSLGVIAGEISASYNAHRNLTSSPLDLPAAQYGDFAIWQNQRLSPERLEEDLAYWERQLAGMQPAAVPTDRPRPPVQTFRGAHQTLALSRSLLEKLRRLAVDENATLYMVFLAAFKMLLSRYIGREDVVLGSPVANRTRAEWEGVIGTFINIVVLRSDLSGNPSLREVVRRVREAVLDAFTHQEMPFQKLVEELAPGRDASRSPLVQILFNFQNAPVGNVNFDGISWAPFEIDQWSSQFDLSVTVDPEITCKVFLSYNTDLYDAATINRLLQHYGEVLDSLAANTDRSLASLSLLVAGPKPRGEDNELAYPQVCLHELFEAQAARTPDAVALVCEDRQLTYRELNERANSLARRLRALGVGPEALVGICAERSLELVAGLLAIAKAGGAYVPIDPAYPSERIAFILNDSAVTALITQRCLLAQLPETDLPVLCLDEMAETGPGPAGNLEPLAGPDNLAYVIYTSGSTGQPKGVQIPHRALVSFLYSMKERLGLSPDDVLLSVTTISFDIAALELFLPLIIGARVVIASRETAADGKALVTQLGACGASVMQATPTSWRMMIEAGWEGSSDFKAICGGESLQPDLARELTSRSGSVWNLYGPTETTVWSSIWAVEPNCERTVIGQPIHNTQVHILDSNLLPLPIGVEGEIYIGGEGLARGYLHRPELTAEKFVPDPLGAPSSRLYRTGDWGRCLADGNIEFIGRIDNQVKVRGFRIELGEVEAVLSGHEDVKQAVMVVSEDGADKRLVAYVVLHHGGAVTERDLGSFAKEKLPGCMVPSMFVFLESLPLTPNGKIDRRALPMPEMSPHAIAVGPRDRLEFEVANIWKRLLRLSALGLEDNFFDLGGNSLLAARLLAAIESSLGKRIRLGDFFACPTVAHVVELLRHDGYSPQWSSLVPIQPLGSKPPFFWVHGLATNVRLPGYLGADQPLYALVPQSQDGKRALYTEIEQMAARYVEELRSVQPEGPYFLGGYSFGGLLVFEVAQQLRKLGQRVASLALLDGTAPVKHNGSGVATLSTSSKLYRHFKLLRGWGGCIYVISRISAKFLRLFRMRRIKKAFERIGYKFFISMGRGIPPICRSTYIADVHRRARRKYRPQTYGGPVVYFQAEGNPDDPLSTWRNLFEGELDVHSIPGNHQTIAQEPQFKIWADKLRDCLNKTQADLSS